MADSDVSLFCIMQETFYLLSILMELNNILLIKSGLFKVKYYNSVSNLKQKEGGGGGIFSNFLYFFPNYSKYFPFLENDLTAES